MHLRAVFEHGRLSGVLLLHVGYMLLVQPHILLQHRVNLPARTVWEVGDGVGFVEYPSGVLAVRGQVVGDHAAYLVVPAYLQDLLKDVIHSLPYLLVRDHINIIKDVSGILQLLHVHGALVFRPASRAWA